MAKQAISGKAVTASAVLPLSRSMYSTISPRSPPASAAANT